jgi:hypothetical protein
VTTSAAHSAEKHKCPSMNQKLRITAAHSKAKREMARAQSAEVDCMHLHSNPSSTGESLPQCCWSPFSLIAWPLPQSRQLLQHKHSRLQAHGSLVSELDTRAAAG